MLYVNGCFQKDWYPQIIHFDRVFHYKPSILGYPLFLETPKYVSKTSETTGKSTLERWMEHTQKNRKKV